MTLLPGRSCLPAPSVCQNPEESQEMELWSLPFLSTSSSPSSSSCSPGLVPHCEEGIPSLAAGERGTLLGAWAAMGTGLEGEGVEVDLLLLHHSYPPPKNVIKQQASARSQAFCLPSINHLLNHLWLLEEQLLCSGWSRRPQCHSPPLRLPPPPLSGPAPGGSRSQLEMAVAARAPQTVGWEEG